MSQARKPNVHRRPNCRQNQVLRYTKKYGPGALRWPDHLAKSPLSGTGNQAILSDPLFAVDSMIEPHRPSRGEPIWRSSPHRRTGGTANGRPRTASRWSNSWSSSRSSASSSPCCFQQSSRPAKRPGGFSAPVISNNWRLPSRTTSRTTKCFRPPAHMPIQRRRTTQTSYARIDLKQSGRITAGLSPSCRTWKNKTCIRSIQFQAKGHGERVESASHAARLAFVPK